jgi:hypothetical protein
MSSFDASNSGAFTTNYSNDSTFYFIGQGTFELWERTITGTGLGTFTTYWTVQGTGGTGQILNIVFSEGDYGNKTVTVILATGGGMFQSGAGNRFQPPSVPCFAEGTKILTQHGYKKIESLLEDDLVVTSDHRTVDFTLLKRSLVATKDTMPYRVEANAFGKNRPIEPIYLSPTHKIQLRKGLWTTAQEASKTNSLISPYGIGEMITYYHIQCEHYLKDNLFAGGLIVESYGASNTKGVYKWNARLRGFTRISQCKWINNI